MKRRVVIGLLGPTLDSGDGARRWERWRPTVAVCQHEDLLIHRFELLHQRKFTRLARTLTEDIKSVSPETEVRSTLVEFDDPWDLEAVFGALHDFARGYRFDTEADDYLVHITTGTHVAQICLFLLTESHHFPAKLLQVSPPREGGSGQWHIIDLDLARYDRIATRFAQEQRDAASFLKSGIATRNKAFNALIDRIEKVAIATRDPLLLTGPTGAGKSQLARRIFELKETRRQVAGKFIEVNCATLRGDAAMSMLFGHVRGSFTGATSNRVGMLRAAHQGVLFLDEIGELGLDEQALLLRCIEEKRFHPVGADREVQSDFQLIAGTNRDLSEHVRAGRFRDDLLARINLWSFTLPGLQHRAEDLEPNLDYELEQYARRTGTRVTFNREARERFLAFATSPSATWPGNFRDLNGAVVRMATLAASGRITADVVDEELARLRATWHGTAPRDPERDLERHLDRARLEGIDHFDRHQLAYVIGVCRASRSLSEAGRKLFQVSRTKKGSTNDADRLRKYLARFGLEWSAIAQR